MPLSTADASAALAEVTEAEARSRALRGYQSAAPHVIIWGVAWAFAYAVSDLAPHWTNAAWLAVIVLGSCGDIAAARADRQGGAGGLIFAGLFAIFLVFISGTIAIMPPTGAGQVGAFIPLVVAAIYAVIGLMGRPRMLVLGGALAVLTLFGFFALPAHFLLWMAAVGGGSLILGGVWLRQV